MQILFELFDYLTVGCLNLGQSYYELISLI